MGRTLTRCCLFFGFVLFAVGVNAADKTYDVDVCVIGAGAGGTTAALSALENGLSVVLLEKMPGLGGGGNYMEGTYAAGSRFQIKENYPYNSEYGFKQIMNFHHWRIEPKLVRTFINATAGNIDYLVDHGVEFEGIRTMFVGYNLTWHVFKNNTGATMIKAFVPMIKSKGGIILTETPGKKLIKDNKGRITGVIAENADGDKITINAKRGVIVATGGFAMNKDMVKKYLTRFPLEGQGSKGREGDGINMMIEAGAATLNMDLGMQAGPNFDVDSSLTFGNGVKYGAMGAVALSPYLHVDMQGERFFDETLPLEYMSNAIERRGGRTWNIIDEAIVRDYQHGKGVARNFGNMYVAGDKLENFDKLIAEAMKEPGQVVVKASNLDELAKKTGMDPIKLKQSVANINKYAEQGYDEEFYKERKYLRKIEKGPFYAFKTVLKMYATLGGAKINENFQVIDVKGNVIPGLYAIGQDAGGLYSDSYDMHVAEGTGSAFAIAGGRLSVKNIKSQGK